MLKVQCRKSLMVKIIIQVINHNPGVKRVQRVDVDARLPQQLEGVGIATIQKMSAAGLLLARDGGHGVTTSGKCVVDHARNVADDDGVAVEP